MRRLAGILTALAFVASLSTAPSLAGNKSGQTMGGRGSTMMMGNSGKMKCPKGKTWVKGYVKKNGQKVKGYCR